MAEMIRNQKFKKFHSTPPPMSPFRIIQDLETIVAQGRNDVTEINQIVNQINIGAEEGFDPDDIHRIVRLVVRLSERLTYKRTVANDPSIKLLKCALPRDLVRGESVVSLLGAMGTFPEELRVLTLQWIRLIFGSLEREEDLHNCYGVLFHFLGYRSLRSHLCPLLHLLTRPSDVLGFRVRRLLRLWRDGNRDPHLTALVRLYHALAPELVDWRDDEIQDRHTSFAPVPAVLRDRLARIRDSGTMTRQRTKDLRDLVLALVEAETRGSATAVLPLEDLLYSGTAHHAWSLAGNSLDQASRAEHWLASEIKQHAMWDRLAVLVEFFQEMPESVWECVKQWIRGWDGTAHGSAVYRMIPYLRPLSYRDLYQQLLSPLYITFQHASCEIRGHIIHTLTELIGHWAELDWDGLSEVEPGYDYFGHYMFGPILRNVNHMQNIRELCSFVSTLCDQSVIWNGDSPIVQHAICSFYETTGVLHTHYDLPFTYPPSSLVVETCLSSNMSLSISWICGLFTLFKSEFESLKDKNVVDIESGLEQIGEFNKLILGLCDALWRCRVFKDEKVSLGVTNKLVASVKSEHSPESLSIFRGSAFLGIAADYAARGGDLGDKVAYVDYLFNERMMSGLRQFLYTYISSLVKIGQ